MKNGYFDCSSYVNRMLVASGVAGGADGKSGAYGTTASMRASGLIKNISTSDYQGAHFEVTELEVNHIKTAMITFK